MRSGTGLLTGAISSLAIMRSTLPSRRRVASVGLSGQTSPSNQRCALHSCGAVAEFHRASRTFPALQTKSSNTQNHSVANHWRPSSVTTLRMEVKVPYVTTLSFPSRNRGAPSTRRLHRRLGGYRAMRDALFHPTSNLSSRPKWRDLLLDRPSS